MLEEGIDNYTFLHKSIMDYYASSFVKRLSEENAQLFYDGVREDHERWRELLNFLKSIDEYRFCKYLKLPAMQSLIDDFIDKIINAEEPDEITSIIESFYPDWQILFHVSKETGNVVLAGFKVDLQVTWEAFIQVAFDLVGEIFNSFNREMSVEDFISTYKVDPTLDYGASISFRHITRFNNVVDLKNKFELLRIKAEKLKVSAENVVNNERKKSFIFQKR